MKIYIVRHAIPESISSSQYKTDAERPLTEAGVAQAQMVANALAAIGVKLNLILTSPYERALETARIIASVFNCEVSKSPKLSPGVATQSFIDSLKSYQGKEELMLVGHEPDMGELVSCLVGGNQMFRLPFRKGAVCCIDCVEIPPAIVGTLDWIITPELISRLVKASV